MYDLAREFLHRISRMAPETVTRIVEVSRYKVNPCNGCKYDCLLRKEPGYRCPLEDDVLDLWRLALNSDLLIYFVPTYGGMPPATWVAFQQRYHGVFSLPEAAVAKDGLIAVVTVHEPLGTKAGDVSQQVIVHSLAGGTRRLISYEAIIPSNYGLNSLRDRLVLHAGIQARIDAMSKRIAQVLEAPDMT